MIDEDHSIYTKSSKDKFIILSLYINNILVVRNSNFVECFCFDWRRSLRIFVKWFYYNWWRSLHIYKKVQFCCYICFYNVIVLNGFVMIDEDHCIYIKRFKDEFIILSLYVNYILVIGNIKEHVNKIKGWLSSNFKMNDISEVTNTLGIKISINCSKKILSSLQELYINKILEWFQM